MKGQLTASGRVFDHYRMHEIETERVGVQARLRSVTARQAMSPEEITAIVRALGDLVKVLNDADPADKIRIYEQLGLRLTYNHGANAVDVELETLSGPGIEDRSAEHVRNSSVRGGIDTITPSNKFRIYSEISIESNRSPAPIASRSIRTWARSQGLDVADRGRLSSAAVKAWQAAQRE